MEKRKNSNIKGYFLTITGAVAWGFSGTCGQYLMNIKGLDASIIANIRLVFAGIILIMISLIKDRKKTFNIFKNKKDTFKLIIFGIFGMLGSQYSYLETVKNTNAPTATILQFLSSIFIVVGICIIEKRLPKKLELIAIITALFGTLVLTTHLNPRALVITKAGLIWGIISAFAAVVYSMLPLQILKKYSSFVVTGFGMFIGGILISIIIQPWNYRFHFDFMTIAGLLGMIIIGTIIAFTFFLTGVSIIGPVKGSLIAGLEAISALFFSVILLNDSFVAMDIAGMALVLLAVTILSFSK